MLALTPPHTLAGFTGAPDTLNAMVRAVQGPQGEQSVFVRRVTEDVVRDVQPKDYLGEILAIKNWVASNVRYTNDSLHVEIVQSPERILKDLVASGKAIGDCDDLATIIACMALQVGRVAQFIVVGFGNKGEFSHVFARVLEPRSRKWVVCDPVAGSDERGMLQRVTTWKAWSLDEVPGHGPVAGNA